MDNESDKSDEQRDSPSAEPKKLSFDQLREGSSEVIIEHQGQQYRLRATRKGGLILNK